MKMSNLLKLLLGNIGFYAVDGEGGGAADDHDLDDDADDDGEEGDSKDEGEGKEGEDKNEGAEGDEKVVIEGEEEEEDKTPEAKEGETDEDREKIRERRREERHDRQQRRKDREESVKRELAAERQSRKDLEARLAAIEGKDKSRELAQIDSNIQRANAAYNFQKERLQQAHEQHDGASAADATEKMLAARDAHNQLKTIKEGFERSLKTPSSASLDPRLVSNAAKFMDDHKWYKAGGVDQDSKIVKVVDDALAEEGWDPTTPEYWAELRARVKKVLPHRVTGGKVTTVDPAPQAKRKSVVSGNGGESSGGGGKGTFTLSKDRVNAMKEAGVWNDPKQRQETIKAYRDYDKQQKTKA